MPLTDQQLRQELVKLGEDVPPITQRNREELRTRLEVLRARARSPVRARRTTSPGRGATRSKPVRGLIELSDSDTDLTANDYVPSRATKAQTRSVAVGRDTHVSPNVTVEVEESIARHRREIQQLIDSARDRTRTAHNNLSTSRYEPSAITPLRPTSSSSRGRSTTSKPSTTARKEPSWFDRTGSSIRSFWKANKEVIINLLKMILIGVLLGGALIVVKKNAKNIIPHRQGIMCTAENATECEDMFPVYNAVKEFLQIRAGEVECGYRGNNDRYVTRDEIGKHLDKKGLKFEHGSDERWKTLVAYILGIHDQSISVFDAKNTPATDIDDARKLSAQEGIYPIACRLQKGVKSAMEHLVWLVLGTTGFLTLGWLLKRHWNKRAESEQTYNDLTEKIINMLEDQYDEHLRDPEAKPWLSINHIRDMLISSHDRHRLKALWERAKKQISENESRVRVESQLIHGEEHDVWRWIQPRASSSPSSPRKKRAESPQNAHEESYVYMPPDVGLTQCLKLRNFFDPDNVADDDEIDLVVDSVQNRCATVRRIEHIGIHSIYVYLKFSSKEAASQGFHLLNNWKYHGREIIAKYLRLERYHEHFPEAIDSSTSN